MEINKERLINLTMSNDKEHVESMLRQVDEISRILIKFGNIELVELGDIFHSVDRASKKAILSIDAIAEPSICIVAPIGSVTLATSSSIFILSAHSILEGRLASDEQVPSDVTVGVKIFL